MEGWSQKLCKAIEDTIACPCGPVVTGGELDTIHEIEDDHDLLLKKELERNAESTITSPSKPKSSLRRKSSELGGRGSFHQEIEVRSSFESTNSQAVKFDKIEIVEFSVRPGDNPSVKYGAPIALGPRVLSKTTRSVDEYEQEKPTKLSRDELYLEGAQRMRILKDSGYNGKEIMQSIKETSKERKSRTKAKEKFLKKLGGKNVLSAPV